MKYILKYQNPFKPIVKAGQFLPNEGKPWGTVMPKTKPKETPKETTNEKVANVLSDLGTRTLSAVGSFGGSVIGDAINDFISPKAAENVEKYTLGIIPHTRPEQYAANRQQGNWNSRLDQASEASAMNLTGQGVTALMQKFGPVIAKKIVDLPANETERVIKKLSNPKLLKKLETQSNMRTAEFPKLDIRGKLIQDRFIKKSDAAIAEKDLASENF